MKELFNERKQRSASKVVAHAGILIVMLSIAVTGAASPESPSPGKKRAAAKTAPKSAPKRASARPDAGEIARFTLHRGPVRAIAVSHDAQYVATAGEDRMSCVLSGPQLKMIRQQGPQGMPLTGVAWMRDRTVILSSRRDVARRGSVFFWDWTSSTLKRTLTDSEHDSSSLRLSADEEKLAVALNDNDARFWHLPSNSRFGLEGPRGDRKCRCVAFSPDSNVLLMGSGGGLLAWHVANDKRGPAGETVSENEALTHSVAFSPEGAAVVTGHADGAVRLWSAADLSHQKVLSGHTAEVFSVQYSPDGKRIASGGADKTIRVWNATSGELERKFTGHTDAVTCVAFYGSSDRLVSGSSDGTVRAWDMTAKARSAAEATEFEIELVEDHAALALRPRQRGKTKVPSASHLDAADKLLREVFRDDFSKATDTVRKRKLAEKLLALGRKKENEPAEGYAALAAARSLALESAAVTIAVDTTVQISSLFDVDDLSLLTETIEKLGTTARTAGDRGELVNVGLRAVEVLLATRRFDEAQRVAKTTDSAAKRLAKVEFTRRTRDLTSRVSGAKMAWTAYQAALKQLRSDSKDSQAHLVVGKHLLFIERDWRKALSHLAKSSDELLREAAAADLENPKEPEKRVTVATRWKEAAAPLPKHEAEVCLALAAYWYERAIPGFTGLRRLKVEKERNSLGDVHPVRQDD